MTASTLHRLYGAPAPTSVGTLRCATPQEYWDWLGRDDTPPEEIREPQRSFCTEADRDWCREQRALGLCCRDAREFHTIQHWRDGDDDAPIRPAQRATPVLVEAFRYPNGSVHVIDGEWTPCGLWVEGFRRNHPRWLELHLPEKAVASITCRTCRLLTTQRLEYQ